MGRLRAAAIVFGALLLLGIGLLFFRSPKPHIEIKAEPLWTLGFVEITNTLLTSWVVLIVIVIIAFFATRKMNFIPSGFQNVVEAVIEALYTLVENTVGPKHARRFFPVIATIFLYILIANWMALLPSFHTVGKVEEVGVDADHFFHEVVILEEKGGVFFVMPNSTEIELHIDEAACEGIADDGAHDTCLQGLRAEAIAHAREEEGVPEDAKLGLVAPYLRSMNTDLMSPLSFAIVSAIFVEWWGISTLGLIGYGKRFFNFGRLAKGNPMGIIDVFVGILELIAEIARIVSFTFRLFGNMLAGEILLLVMTFLVPFLLILPFYGLELFVGAIQAFVFAMLTLVFAALAVTSHDDHDEGESHGSGGEVAAAHPEAAHAQ